MSKSKNRGSGIKFQCQACKTQWAGYSSIQRHLTDKHGFKIGAPIKGKKRLTMHVDGRDFYTSYFEWTLKGGLTINSIETNARPKDDLMRYA